MLSVTKNYKEKECLTVEENYTKSRNNGYDKLKLEESFKQFKSIHAPKYLL